MRSKTDARTVGTAAHVRATECPGAVPCGCDHLARRQTAVGDLGFDGCNVVVAVACWDRILPDEVFGRSIVADVATAWTHVAVGEFEPSPREGVCEVVRVGHEFLADLVIDRIDFHRHIRVCHHRLYVLGQVSRVHRHRILWHIHRLPLVSASGRFGKLPVVAKQVVEIAHVPFGRLFRPRTFNAGGKCVGRFAVVTRVGPAEALSFDTSAFWFGTDCIVGTATPVGFPDGMTATGQRRGFFVVHCHTREGFTDVQRGARRIRVAVHAFGVHVDEAHVHCRKRVLERGGIVEVIIAVFARSEPFVLRTPVNVFLGTPDVFAAKAEAESLQAHGFISHVACKDNQVSPGKRVAVLLFDRPQQATGFVEAGVIWPGVQRCKADVAGPCPATTVLHAVRACGVPCEADHKATIVTPVGWPPVLAFGHQRFDIGFHRVEVERFDGFAEVEIGIHRVRARTVLVQDVQVQRVGPPLGDGFVVAGVATVHDRASTACWEVVAVHVISPVIGGVRIYLE